MAQPREEKGVGGWIRRWWRALLAEVISTALLILLGCATLVPIAGPNSVVLLHPALAFGCGMIANICAFGEVSGAHMNPALTLGALLYGKIDPILAIGYVIAQMLGAILGFGGLMILSPPDLVAMGIGITRPGPGVSPLAAVIVETIITAMVLLAACGMWAADDPAHPDTTAPVKLGLIVTGVAFAGGPASGASLNPARSFAPALLQGIWEYQWVYWVGPLLGAAIGALLHRHVIAPPRKPSVPKSNYAEVSINEKP